MPYKDPEDQRAYQRDWQRRRKVEEPDFKERMSRIHRAAKDRQQAAARVLQDQYRIDGCVVCGETDPVVLDFHHRDQTLKVMGVAEMIARGHKLESVREELEKCVVICANDHRRLHAGTVQLPEVVQGGNGSLWVR